MKKYMPIMMIVLSCFLSGCTIDYDAYYQKYGDISNKDETLNSVKIDETVLNYPNTNTSLVEKYSMVYEEVEDEYNVYSTYYSSTYNTIYISYDNKNEPVQTIKSKELALIEEHLLNYFEMDENKILYKDYLKVVRVYPDYASSTCRGANDSEDTYSKIEGCATYNALEGAINLNGLTTIERFFNPYKYSENNTQYTIEPKRDTFAHEFGHVATYYHMILKGDGSYEDYLRLRLGSQYDVIYEDGLPNEYSSSDGYYTQPVEILADDYVEMYYQTGSKVSNDYYDYEIEYEDLRNSLTDVRHVSKFLKEDNTLFNTIRDYYDQYIKNDYMDYDTKKVVTFSGNVFSSIHHIIDNEVLKQLENKDLIVLGEVTIDDNTYYRVVLSNIVTSTNVRREYHNIGYVLKSECVDNSKTVFLFTSYNNQIMSPDSYLHLESKSVYIMPYYDFSYYIYDNDNNSVSLYNHLDADFQPLYMQYEDFI